MEHTEATRPAERSRHARLEAAPRLSRPRRVESNVDQAFDNPLSARAVHIARCWRMTSQTPNVSHRDDARLMLWAALVVALLSTIGSDALAAAIVERRATFLDLSWWSGVLMLPAVLVGVFCAEIARLKSTRYALVLFAISAILLGALYFRAYYGFHSAMRDERWTASALVLGLLPFWTVPILFVCFAVWAHFKLKNGT